MKKKKSDQPTARPERKRYQKPELKVHGDIRVLTATKGGTKADGVGKPKTKAAGGAG